MPVYEMVTFWFVPADAMSSFVQMTVPVRMSSPETAVLKLTVETV